LLFCLLKQITGRLSADAGCQMADTDYRPIIGAPLTYTKHESDEGNNRSVTVVTLEKPMHFHMTNFT